MCICARADMSAAPSFASTPMSSAAHHAAAEHDNIFPTVSSAQSSDIHADPQHYSSRPEQYDDDGILNDSEPPSRQVCARDRPNPVNGKRTVQDSVRAQWLPMTEETMWNAKL